MDEGCQWMRVPLSVQPDCCWSEGFKMLLLPTHPVAVRSPLITRHGQVSLIDCVDPCVASAPCGCLALRFLHNCSACRHSHPLQLQSAFFCCLSPHSICTASINSLFNLQERMLNIHEYQSVQLMRENGVHVPSGELSLESVA